VQNRVLSLSDWGPHRGELCPDAAAGAVSACLQVTPGVAVDTYDDHRMAMAFSLAAAAGVPVTINDPGCTRKTFPTYFKVLESVTRR
jgi:5-enolpyruvylshikimate-3-phosphate synthase